MYKQYLNSKERRDYIQYTKARNQAKSVFRIAKQEYEQQLARNSKDNPKVFYKYVNSMCHF